MALTSVVATRGRGIGGALVVLRETSHFTGAKSARTDPTRLLLPEMQTFRRSTWHDDKPPGCPDVLGFHGIKQAA